MLEVLVLQSYSTSICTAKNSLGVGYVLRRSYQSQPLHIGTCSLITFPLGAQLQSHPHLGSLHDYPNRHCNKTSKYCICFVYTYIVWINCIMIYNDIYIYTHHMRILFINIYIYTHYLIWLWHVWTSTVSAPIIQLVSWDHMEVLPIVHLILTRWRWSWGSYPTSRFCSHVATDWCHYWTPSAGLHDRMVGGAGIWPPGELMSLM